MNDLWFLLLRARAETTLPLGIALAVLVSLHVLLHKRQVASAVGWIGLAWFAPITGALAYVMFGVNRVRRRARLLRPPRRGCRLAIADRGRSYRGAGARCRPAHRPAGAGRQSGGYLPRRRRSLS